MFRGMFLCVMVLGSLSAPAAYPQDDIIIIEDESDDIIIIEDESSDIIVIDDDDDDLIVIDDDDDGGFIVIEEGDPPSEAPKKAPTMFQRFWDSVSIEPDAKLYGDVHLSSRSFRPRLDAEVKALYAPIPQLKVYTDLFARMQSRTDSDEAFEAYGEVREAYLKLSPGSFTLQLGRMILPSRDTRAFALSDHLNPADYRFGEHFGGVVNAKVPQWGISARSSWGPFSATLASMLFSPSQGSLCACDQGGFRLGQYQGALSQSAPLRDRGELNKAMRFEERAILGLRLATRFRDTDITASVTNGPDQTPVLNLFPVQAQALAAGQNVRLDADSLSYIRTTKLSLSAALGFGVVILRASGLAQPLALGQGSTTLILTPEGLKSRQLDHYAGVLALEGALFEYLDGSLEVLERVWLDAPEQSRLLGIEPEDNDRISTAHRTALGLSLDGAFFESSLFWRFRGETGLTSRDLSSSLTLGIERFGIRFGIRGDVFAGEPGTPGDFRQNASRIGLFVGQDEG